MKKRNLICMITGVIMVTLLTVLAIPGSLQAESKKDTLIVGVPVSASGVDPDVNSGPEEWHILGTIFEPAVRWPMIASNYPGGQGVRVPDFNKVEPRLWESWELSDDQKTLTVRLRKGVLSNAGNEFTTKDVLWTYQRWFTIKGVGKFFLDTANITNPDNVKIIDDYTFSLTADRKNPMILGVHLIYNHSGYWDSTEAKKHATAKDPWAQEWLKTHSASFGAYFIKEWKPGDRIVLEANSNYYKGKPAIKTIIRKVIPESFSRVAMLKSGTIDVARALSPKEIESLKNEKGIKVINIPGNMCNMLFMNAKFKPWDNKTVRQAVSYAIPREEIIRTAMYGYAKPMTSIGPSMYPMALPAKEFPYNYDLDKARALLKKAGFSDGFDCELTYNPLYPPDEVTATLIKSSLSEIGINVALRKIPYGTFVTELYQRDIPFGFQTIQPFHPDAFYGLVLQWITGGFDNISTYSNPEVDKLINEGLEVMDKEKRKEAAYTIIRKVIYDAPVVWILERNYTMALRDNIAGWNWNTWEGTYLSEVSFK